MKILGGAVVLLISLFVGLSPARAADPVFERTFGFGVTGNIGFENCPLSPACMSGLPSDVAGSMDLPADTIFDNHGGLLVVDSDNARINRYLVGNDGTVTFDRTFGFGVQDGMPDAFQNCVSSCETGESSEDPGALDFPWKAALDNQGRLLVTEYSNSRISRFTIAADGTATFDRAFGWDVVPGGVPGLEACTTACQAGQPASGAAGSLNGPDGIAVDAEGGILVGEYDNDRISRFTISEGGVPSFDRAFGLDVIPGGGTGFENCTTDTTCKEGINGAGFDAAGSAADNYDLAIGPDGRIFSADFENNRVDIFTRAAGGAISFDRAFGQDVVPGGGTGFETCTTATGCQAGAQAGDAGAVNGGAGLELDAAGGLYVMTERGRRFNYFTPVTGGGFSFDFAYGLGVNGGTEPEPCRSSCMAGQIGVVGGAFDVPQGMALDPDGLRMYAADYENNRIQAFEVGPKITVTSQLSPSTDPGRFDLEVGSATVKSGAGNGDTGSVRVAAGSVTVSEAAVSGTNLSDYTTTIDCGGGPVTGTSLTVDGVTEDLDCTVSNVRKPVPPPSKPNFSKLVLQPKKKKVKAGKKVKLKVKVTNSGGTKGTATVKLSSSAKKKATVPKSIKVTVGPGKTVTKSFKVKTKKKKGKVKIKAKLGNRTAKTVLTLKKK